MFEDTGHDDVTDVTPTISNTALADSENDTEQSDVPWQQKAKQPLKRCNTG